MELERPKPKVDLTQTTAYNAETTPGDAEMATRVWRCLGGAGCSHAVFEYGPYADSTDHVNGVPEETIRRASEAGAAIVSWKCEKHDDGLLYDPAGPYVSLRRTGKV